MDIQIFSHIIMLIELLISTIIMRYAAHRQDKIALIMQSISTLIYGAVFIFVWTVGNIGIKNQAVGIIIFIAHTIAVLRLILIVKKEKNDMKGKMQ